MEAHFAPVGVHKPHGEKPFTSPLSSALALASASPNTSPAAFIDHLPLVVTIPRGSTHGQTPHPATPCFPKSQGLGRLSQLLASLGPAWLAQDRRGGGAPFSGGSRTRPPCQLGLCAGPEEVKSVRTLRRVTFSSIYVVKLKSQGDLLFGAELGEDRRDHDRVLQRLSRTLPDIRKRRVTRI
mgnify:CR=1 FL=1